MTAKEAAVIQIFTGTVMLKGDQLKYAYEYASKLIGRPIYTHEFYTLEEELKERSRNLNDQCGGQLNPEWVEWLMGFPVGWTDIGTQSQTSQG